MRDVGTPDEVVVNEVYVSLQGEGTRAGSPCVFVRLTGCGLRCRWCDTAYAFEEGSRRRVGDVVADVAGRGVSLALVTGGEPLEQPGAGPLVGALCDAGLTVLVETGGHLPTDALDPRAVRIVDVKLPGSGMAHRNHPRALAAVRACDEVKFVVADRADFERALAAIAAAGLGAVGCPLLFSPVHGELAAAELAGWLLEARVPRARLNLQLHKLIWPHAERGV